VISKIESFCSSYLNGVPEFKAYANQSYGKTAFAALKVFTYIASLAVLPTIALGVRYVCRKLSTPVVPGPVVPMPISPNPQPQAPAAPVKPDPLLIPAPQNLLSIHGVIGHLKNIQDQDVQVRQRTKVNIAMKDGTNVKLSYVMPLNSNKGKDYNHLNVYYFRGVDETNGTSHINPEESRTWTRREIPIADIVSANVTIENSW
jgi:hypothetical protein